MYYKSLIRTLKDEDKINIIYLINFGLFFSKNLFFLCFLNSTNKF